MYIRGSYTILMHIIRTPLQQIIALKQTHETQRLGASLTQAMHVLQCQDTVIVCAKTLTQKLGNDL